MAWDLATIKLMLGYTDNSYDAQLTNVMDMVLTSIETVLGGRGLLKQQDTGEFYQFERNLIAVRRFPIESVDEINGVADPEVEFDAQRGFIEYVDYEAPAVVKWTGGYDPAGLPPELEMAMLEAFNLKWSQLNPDTGLPDPTNPSGGVTVGGGELASVTLQDFGTVRYSTSTTASSDTGIVGDSSWWGWLAPWSSVLQYYRLEGSSAGLCFC